MKNTNKPQWLIDAEKDINEFHETKYGKMTNKEFRRNIASKENGAITFKRHPNMASENGKKTGKLHVESGHLENVRDIDKMLDGAKDYFKDRQNERISVFNERIKIDFSAEPFTLNDLNYLHTEFTYYKNPRQEFRRILMHSGFYEEVGKRKQSILYKKINN